MYLSIRTVLLALALAASGPALAQQFPSKNVTIVVPNPPGGSIDVMARVFADGLQPRPARCEAALRRRPASLPRWR